MTRRIKLYTHIYIYITCEITELPHESLLLPSYTVQPSDYSGEKKKKTKTFPWVFPHHKLNVQRKPGQMSSMPARLTSLPNTSLIQRDLEGPRTSSRPSLCRNRNKILLSRYPKQLKAVKHFAKVFIGSPIHPVVRGPL